MSKNTELDGSERKNLRICSRSCKEAFVVKLKEASLSRYELENFKGRFFLLVDRSGEGCWPCELAWSSS